MIYFIIIFFLGTLATLFDFGNVRGGKKIMKIISWLVLVLLFGLRYRVGGDTLNYMLSYESLPTFSQLFSEGMDLGRYQPFWQLLCATAKLISSDFVVLQIIHAVIVNTIIFRFIDQNTRYFFTGVLVYFMFYGLHFNMEILRESLAVAIFLLSLKSFTKRRWLRYYLLVVLAFLVHYSAIILFVLPLFKGLKVNLRNVIFIFAYFIVGLVFSRLVLLFLGSLESGSGFYAVISPYLNYTFTIWGILYVIIAYMIFPVLIYILAKNHYKIDVPHYQFLAFYILVGASISYFAIFFRFLNYFTPILCIYIVEVIHALFRERGKLQIRVMGTSISFALICFLFVNRYFSNTSDLAPNTRWYDRWHPYVSIIDKKIIEDRERLVKAESDRERLNNQRR